MLIGLREVLDLARTPQERQEMKERFIRFMEMDDDDDIDFSDIPRITDFSRFVPGKPIIDKMREVRKKLAD